MGSWPAISAGAAALLAAPLSRAPSVIDGASARGVFEFAQRGASVNLIQAFIRIRTHGGLTLKTTETSAGIPNLWNGTSSGTTLPASFLNNASYIEANFVCTPIPTSSAFAAVGPGIGLFAA